MTHSERQDNRTVPMPDPTALVILREEADWAACVKPVGVDSEHEMPDLLKAQLGGEWAPVHRLDLNVGGAMIFARTKAGAAAFSRMMQAGTFRKEYLAEVHGAVPDSGRMEDLLWKDARKNHVFVVKRMRAGVRQAVLTYETLERIAPDRTRVRVLPETGRSHQIRVQFASRGWPLWGDHKYGARDEGRQPRLYSHRLIFPWRGETVEIEAELPQWDV